MTAHARGIAVAILSAIVLVTAGVGPALARSSKPGTASTTGNDISWPQCGGSYPTGQAFGIVGVNDGLANAGNTCLGSELSWAWRSSGSSSPGKVPPAQLYVNTADPSPAVADWPKNDSGPNGIDGTNPYRSCTTGPDGKGLDDQACAWQYGWNMAVQDQLDLVGAAPAAHAAPSDYWWWLDVETANTWETGTAGLENNIADLEGMVAALRNANATVSGVALGGAPLVGIYSTSYQFGQISGGPTMIAGTTLAGLPDWIPGARTSSAAASNCSLASFTSGSVLMTQWFGKPFDGDYACGV